MQIVRKGNYWVLKIVIYGIKVIYIESCVRIESEEFTIISRYKSNRDGRSVVEVKDNTGETVAIGVCPACFNSIERRKKLIKILSEKGYFVITSKDDINGIYIKNSTHAPRCPYKNMV